MNSRIQCYVAALSVATLLPVLRAADEAAPAKDDKKSMRVLSAPGRETRSAREGERRDKVEKETVAFLGVETAPVSATTGIQLGLPRGTGLVVNHVVPKSVADGVLSPHDILLKLDDQILIETRQLSVLIRNHKEGDEVTLTYLRGGQRATAKVKLGKTEVSKTAGSFGVGPTPFIAPFPGNRFEYSIDGGPDEERADVDRVLSMIRRGPNGDPVRIQVDPRKGPGFRAMALHTGNSNMVYSDDEGSLELTAQDGSKTLVAKTAQGEQLFSGPVNTPEERKALPEGVRARLEKLEGMHDITFRTDGDFRGAEVRVMRPRGITFPLPDYMPLPSRPPAFY
jgi:serine protease Do